MKALGLIETYGLVAAVEGADAMLKAAQVSLFDRTLVGAGLVTVTVTGDVAAVTASVDAAQAAIDRIDTEALRSRHVIARPDEALKDMGWGPSDPEPSPDSPVDGNGGDAPHNEPDSPSDEPEDEVADQAPQEAVALEAAATEPEEELPEVTQGPEADGANTEPVEVPGDVDVVNLADLDRLAGAGNPEAVADLLNRLKVVQLKKFAREAKSFPMESRKISRASKQKLIEAFEARYNRS